MLKKIFPTIFISALAIVFLIQAIAATALFLTPKPTQAANNFTLEVPIGSLSSIPMGNSTEPIAVYIKTIYNFAVGAVGIVAAVVLMIGGVIWITAGGNASNVGEAKSMITAALTGMVLVLTSYLLLDQINPALVNLSSNITAVTLITVSAPQFTTTATCNWTDAKTNSATIAVGGGVSDDCPVGLTAGKTCTGKGNAFQICCCQVVITQTTTASAGTGSCAVVTDGSCSSANMTVFGAEAAHASAICHGESGGSPSIPSGTDICADGNPASWGLFQINITANKIGGYDCPSAFSGGTYTGSNHNCRVIDQTLYNNCVAAAKDPATNIQAAYGIYKNVGSWKPWGFYTRNCSSAF
jgi:hypothetical protein